MMSVQIRKVYKMFDKAREEIRKLYYPQETGTYTSGSTYDEMVENGIDRILNIIHPLIEKAKKGNE